MEGEALGEDTGQTKYSILFSVFHTANMCLPKILDGTSRDFWVACAPKTCCVQLLLSCDL